MWQLVNSQGEKIGHYTGDSPGSVAKKIAKSIYQQTEKKHNKIKFVNNQTKKVYYYETLVKLLKKPKLITIGNKQIPILYDIEVKRL